MRVLFFNEGNLGGYILGQAQLTGALRVGLAETPDVEASFDGLEPFGWLSGALAQRPLPLLGAHNLDFKVLRWHTVQSLRARRGLRRALARAQPDVVHLHTQSIALASASIMRARPVVLSIDTTIVEWSEMPAWAPRRNLALALGPSRALERRVLKAAALVQAWTGWARAGIEREQPAANVIALHPGLDLEHYRPAPRAPRERMRVLFVGGRFEEKGGEDLLAAAAPRVQRGELELDLVTRAGVEPRQGVRVHHLEAGDERLLELYQQADLLCLPTHGDSVPWVLLEAMACGVPVLSTRVGAIPEILDGGRCGVLIDHGDRRALGEALGALLADDGHRGELGAAGRAHCERDYDARRQIPKLVEHLRALAGPGGGGAAGRGIAPAA